MKKRNKKHIEYIYKIGDIIDDNAFGGHVVTEESRKHQIESIKKRWRETIKCPLMLFSKAKYDSNHVPPHFLEFSKKKNPYYGWTEEQLEIREYGTEIVIHQ